MNKTLKSISYAFIAQDLEVFIPDGETDCVIISKLVCSNCGEFWHTSMLECYFCGELNYYLYRCTACGRKYSITNSSIKCICGLPNSRLIKACVNDECLTNIDPDIQEISIKEGGVFHLSSSMNTSLNYCVKCGNISNEYRNIRVYIYYENDSKYKNIKEFIQEKNDVIGIDDVVILKRRVGDKLEYGFLRVKDVDNNYKPDYPYQSISEIVKCLYPVKM